jgi:two-component system chemotaxis sensor kinase CheA
MDADSVDRIIESGGIQNDTPFGDIDPEFLNDFILDTREHIEKIEMDALLLETGPDDKEAVNSLFREFHTIKGSAGFVEQQLIQDIAHQTETLLEDCRTGNIRVNKYIVDLILDSSDFIKKLCDDVSLNRDGAFLKLTEAHLQRLSDKGEALRGSVEQGCGQAEKLGEILVREGKIKSEDVGEILIRQQTDYAGLKFGQIVLKEKKAEANEVVESLRKQEYEAKKAANDSGHIRIPVRKVDNLVDMMGELIITQSLVEQEMGKRFGADDKLLSDLLKMSRITKDIQNLSMSLRMVSLKSTFQKINRIGRDTIAGLGKNINIRLSGEETEIDRGVAEKIFDPLIHIVKNCISHGIEDERERLEKGKPAQGQIRIEAYNKRGSIYIEISDDGSGIDTAKVYNKAVEKNLISPSAGCGEEEILNLIFLPGFSTAETVNSVSGRGVGLDVVKTEVSKIGGKVEVISQRGKGCKFVLKMPINLAVMNGTIVDIMGSHYIIPTLNIKKIFKPEQGQWVSVKGKRAMVRDREDIIPIIPLDSIHAVKEGGGNSGADLIVVIELEQKQKALLVSSIVGKQEVVVKSLGYEFSSLDFISGASILGDGRVALILDVENLFRMEGES